jgi:cupin 2 domain-containing protein
MPSPAGDEQVARIEVRNIFDGVSSAPSTGNESADGILMCSGCKIERIVSHAHASPPGFWYEQAWDEWVIVWSGCAKLRFEDEAEARLMKGGDYVFIPAKKRHRVDWTSGTEPTVWLAVHFYAEEQMLMTPIHRNGHGGV